MRKIILIGLFLLLSRPASAAEPVSTASQELINKVTKIAETAATFRRTYSGTVKSLGTTSLVISAGDSDRTITTNNVTTFYRIRAGNRTEINFKALKAGDDLIALGTTDPQTAEMTARQIIAKIKRVNLVGTLDTLGKIDLADATLKKISGGKIVPAKISDFKPESFVFVLAYSSDPSSPDLTALKALIFLP